MCSTKASDSENKNLLGGRMARDGIERYFYLSRDFADLFVSKGAKVVVGFEGTINQVAARFWNGRFWEFLTKEGKTVEKAATDAVKWCRWFPWSGLDTLYITGNGGETIY